MTRSAAILAALLLVASMTLFPTSDRRASGFAFCLVCGEMGTLDLLLNVALFVPLGAALAWRSPARSRIVRAACVAALVSLIVELGQLQVVPGRDPSLADLVANTAGGALGAAAVVFIRRMRHASVETWWRVTGLWTLVSAALIGFGAWAVRMHVPNEVYYAQWLPRRHGYSIFLGRLSNFALDGRRLGYGEFVLPHTLPSRFFAGDMSLTAEIVPGERPVHLAFIARLALSANEFFMIGRQQDALVVRYRTNASRVGLRSPVFALGEVFAGDSLAPLRMYVGTQRDEVRMRVSGAAGARERVQRVSGARLWASVLPFDHGFGSLGALGDMLWLAILFAPAGYGGAKAGGGGRGAGFALALAGVVALLAFFYQRTLWWWPLWLAVAAATVVSYWLGARSGARAAAGAVSA